MVCPRRLSGPCSHMHHRNTQPEDDNHTASDHQPHAWVTHQDIRLENICFDEDCMPVFIDLDRCIGSSERAYEGKGCMYSLGRGSAIQTDWLPLGLMVCWVLDPELGQEEEEGDYHNRDCKKICES